MEILQGIFKDKVDSEWKWLDDLLSAIYNSLAEASNIMLAGTPVYTLQSSHFSLKELTRQAHEPSPYSQRAESIRAELSDSVGLKLKLDEKDKELLECRKQIQIKDGELSDAKWKEQSLEKQIQKATKEVSSLFALLRFQLDKVSSQLSEEEAKRAQQEKVFVIEFGSNHDRIICKP